MDKAAKLLLLNSKLTLVSTAALRELFQSSPDVTLVEVLLSGSRGATADTLAAATRWLLEETRSAWKKFASELPPVGYDYSFEERGRITCAVFESVRGWSARLRDDRLVRDVVADAIAAIAERLWTSGNGLASPLPDQVALRASELCFFVRDVCAYAEHLLAALSLASHFHLDLVAAAPHRRFPATGSALRFEVLEFPSNRSVSELTALGPQVEIQPGPASTRDHPAVPILAVSASFDRCQAGGSSDSGSVVAVMASCALSALVQTSVPAAPRARPTRAVAAPAPSPARPTPARPAPVTAHALLGVRSSAAGAAPRASASQRAIDSLQSLTLPGASASGVIDISKDDEDGGVDVVLSGTSSPSVAISSIASPPPETKKKKARVIGGITAISGQDVEAAGSRDNPSSLRTSRIAPSVSKAAQSRPAPSASSLLPRKAGRRAESARHDSSTPSVALPAALIPTEIGSSSVFGSSGATAAADGLSGSGECEPSAAKVVTSKKRSRSSPSAPQSATKASMESSAASTKRGSAAGGPPSVCDDEGTFGSDAVIAAFLEYAQKQTARLASAASSGDAKASRVVSRWQLLEQRMEALQSGDKDIVATHLGRAETEVLGVFVDPVAAMMAVRNGGMRAKLIFQSSLGTPTVVSAPKVLAAARLVLFACAVADSRHDGLAKTARAVGMFGTLRSQLSAALALVA